MMKKILIALLALMIAPVSWAIDEDELLAPEQAFPFHASVSEAGFVDFKWEIAEGYYLYRSRLKFNSQTPSIILGDAMLPDGKKKHDEFFGDVEIYHHELAGRLPYQGSSSNLSLQVESQGCAEIGVCYPPFRQTVNLSLPETSVSVQDLFANSPVNEEASDDTILPVDEAFVLDAISVDDQSLLLRFETQAGYHLYRDKIKLEILDNASVQIQDLSLPPGKLSVDPEFGEVQVYEGLVEIPVKLERVNTDATEMTLQVKYQGCKHEAICYPPQTKTFKLNLAAVDSLTPGTSTKSGTPSNPVIELSEQDRLAAALAGEGWLTVLSFFGFGLLLAFTPCVFPMIPILSGIIAGQGENMNARKGFVLSLVYVLAMAVTYTVAGVIAGLFGQNLQAAFQNPWILSSFSLVFVILAFSMFGFFELQLPSGLQSKLTHISNRQQGGSLLGVAIMGFLSALIVGPCVAPPLAAALIYIGQSQDPILGGAALFSLSMGMGLPLIVVGTGAGKYLPRAGGWMDGVKAVFGVMLLGLAIWMLERILPGSVVMLLWGVLLFSSGVYMGAFEPIAEAASGWKRLWKSLGLILSLLGAAELLGGIAGGDNWLQPLSTFQRPVQAGGVNQAAHELTFKTITSPDELEQSLAAAKSQDKKLMLDFYADWCVECKRMEKTTFQDGRVITALEGTVLIKADVTANNSGHQAMLQKYGLIGPPATIFYHENGEEVRHARLVGYLDGDAFLQHLKKAE